MTSRWKIIYCNTKHTALSYHYLNTVIKYGGVSGDSHVQYLFTIGLLHDSCPFPAFLRYITHFLLGLFVCSTLRSFKHLVWSLQRETFGGSTTIFQNFWQRLEAHLGCTWALFRTVYLSLPITSVYPEKSQRFSQITSNHFSLSLKKKIAYYRLQKSRIPRLYAILFFFYL